MRKYNTDRQGRNFTAATVDAVWRKGLIVAGYDPNQLRKDACGAWIRRLDYGNTRSQNGWEIDHIKPTSKGGADSLDNLQPMQWENNRSKGDNYPNWSCAIRAA